MLKNYFTIALRNLLRQKIYSLITISGLAIGLGVFMFFFKFYNWATAADSFHKDINRIYNIVQVVDSGSELDRHTAYIQFPLARAIKNEIPEIEEYTRFYDPGNPVVSYKEKKFYENQVLFVDQNFPSFFTFNIIEGNKKTFLSNPNSVVVSESIAKKYFGDEIAIGKILTFDNKMDFTVTGVFQDLNEQPSSSSLYGQFMLPIESASTLYGSLDDWKQKHITGFVRIKEGSDIQQIEGKLELLRKKYFQSSTDSPKQLYLFPTKGIRYQAIHIQKFAGYSSLVGYTIFLILGFLFLLIVIFNYINLSTARYTERLNEIGVRKVVGGNRFQLFKQFLCESLLITLIALPFAFFVYNIAASAFSERIGLTINFSLWANSSILVAFIITTLSTGIFAGIYPAFFLSSFRPIQILKGKLIKSRGMMRKFLVVLQFSVSIILIVFALVWQKQTDFLYKTDLGYNRKGIIVVPVSGEAKTNLHLITEKLKTYPEISFVTASEGIPGGWWTKQNVVPEGMDVNNALTPYVYGIDYDFLESLNIQFTLGRSFSKYYQDENKFIINQLFVDKMKWENPIGKTLKVGDKSGVVIGVVKNSHFIDTFFKMTPAVFYIEPNDLNYLLIKTKPENFQDVKEYAHLAWNEFSPDIPFENFTLDEYFNRKYNGGTYLISELLSVLGIIAVFFSCLGLLALSSYTVRQRTKEIGVRKVLGASLSEILRLLSTSFLKLILISNIVALPVAYLASKSLLEYASAVRTSIGFTIFLFTILITLLVALISILSQTYKAANRNPVESLKYE